MQEVRWSAIADGRETLQESLFHYCRRQTGFDESIARQPAEVAESIRQILAFDDDSHPGYADVARRIPVRGLQESSAREILEACARYLESGAWRSAGSLADTPPKSIELRGWFPELLRFTETYLQPADGEDAMDIVADYIDDCHPNCLWVLPALIGETYRALATCASEEQMVAAFDGELSMTSVTGMTWTEWFSYLARTLSNHMSEAHSGSTEGHRC